MSASSPTVVRTDTSVFLASDWARYLTGRCIAVDGAYTAQ